MDDEECVCRLLSQRLPLDLARVIAEVSHNALHRELYPYRDGAPSRPCFAPGLPYKDMRAALFERRVLSARLPPALAAFYECFPRDVAFAGPDSWYFLSEREILERQEALARAGQTTFCDIAFSYVGMGYILTLCYAPDSGTVFSMMDGGSSMYSRLQSFRSKVILDDPATSLGVCRWWPSFAHWWNQLPHVHVMQWGRPHPNAFH